MDETVLHEFVSHIEGKNANVRIYPDRVEWARAGKVSKGKAALGVMTAGMSLAATGVRSQKGSSEMIPIKSLTSVTTEKDGFQMKVVLVTSGNTVEMRVSKGEALAVKDTLTRLMLGTHPSQQVKDAVPGSLPPRHAATETGDPTSMLKKLAEMRDEGLISEAQFEVKRQEILDRL